MEKFIMAACQIDCGPASNLEDNLDNISSHILECARQGARLILFPELCLTGYTVNKDEILRRSMPLPCASTEKIQELVRQLNISVAVGLIETAREKQGAYNTVALITGEGIKARYRKIHIPPGESAFLPGEKVPVVTNLGFINLGISVCFDNWFGETARMAFLGGAHVLHMPFFWPADWEVELDLKHKRVPENEDAILRLRRERMMKVFPARALDNAVYLVMLDQVHRGGPLSERVPGKSMIFDPYGDLIAETKGWSEEVLYAEINPELQDMWRRHDFFPGNHARPDIYKRAYDSWSGADK